MIFFIIWLKANWISIVIYMQFIDESRDHLPKSDKGEWMQLELLNIWLLLRVSFRFLWFLRVFLHP